MQERIFCPHPPTKEMQPDGLDLAKTDAILPQHPLLFSLLEPVLLMSQHPDESTNLNQLDSLASRMGESTVSKDDGIVDLEEREAPGALMFMPPMLQELWAKKAYFTMGADGKLAMEGFYKNGPLVLELRGTREAPELVATDKRGRETKIKSFDDLVALNYFWWRQSQTKTSIVLPVQPFVNAFLEKKLIKRRVIFVAHDEDSEGED